MISPTSLSLFLSLLGWSSLPCPYRRHWPSPHAPSIYVSIVKLVINGSFRVQTNLWGSFKHPEKIFLVLQTAFCSIFVTKMPSKYAVYESWHKIWVLAQNFRGGTCLLMPHCSYGTVCTTSLRGSELADEPEIAAEAAICRTVTH